VDLKKRSTPYRNLPETKTMTKPVEPPLFQKEVKTAVNAKLAPWKRPSLSPIVPVRITDESNVRSTFLELVSHTCPTAEAEEARFGAYLTGTGWTVDEVGNYWKTVGESTTMFTAHLDDVSTSHLEVLPIITVEKSGDEVAECGDAEVLGGDAKAGMAVMLYMISQGVPGTYVLFSQEEIGRVGSIAAVSGIKTGQYNRCVSFDRKGVDDIITFQSGIRTCSDEFGEALAASLLMNHKICSKGSYTDSYSFRGVIPECTNVAVGYDFAHTEYESQNLTYLTVLAEACTEVNWEMLPTKRKPTFEFPTYTAPAYNSSNPSNFRRKLAPYSPQRTLERAIEKGETGWPDSYEIEDSVVESPVYWADFVASICGLFPEQAKEVMEMIRPRNTPGINPLPLVPPLAPKTPEETQQRLAELLEAYSPDIEHQDRLLDAALNKESN
jgi:hypothetical protein